MRKTIRGLLAPCESLKVINCVARCHVPPAMAITLPALSAINQGARQQQGTAEGSQPCQALEVAQAFPRAEEDRVCAEARSRPACLEGAGAARRREHLTAARWTGSQLARPPGVRRSSGFRPQHLNSGNEVPFTKPGAKSMLPRASEPRTRAPAAPGPGPTCTARDRRAPLRGGSACLWQCGALGMVGWLKLRHL